jgi:hypothetical protein
VLTLAKDPFLYRWRPGVSPQDQEGDNLTSSVDHPNSPEETK